MILLNPVPSNSWQLPGSHRPRLHHSFKDSNATLTHRIARACKNVGTPCFIHMSHINADYDSKSLYLQSKALSEEVYISTMHGWHAINVACRLMLNWFIDTWLFHLLLEYWLDISVLMFMVSMCPWSFGIYCWREQYLFDFYLFDVYLLILITSNRCCFRLCFTNCPTQRS